MNHRGIGSTRIAMLTGHSPWGGPWECYRGIVDGWKQEESFKMELGTLLEPVIIELARRRLALTEVIAKPGTIAHPEIPFAVDSPDAFAMCGEGGPVIIEAKSCDPFAMDDFGEDGTDAIKPGYLVQCMWHLGVCRAAMGLDYQTCLVPVLFGTREFRIYQVAWDAEMFDGLLTVARDFWTRHIETKTPPEIDGSRACSGYLSDHFGPPKAHRVPADESIDSVARELRKAKAEAERWSELARKHENQIKARISEAGADGLYAADWSVTFKEDKNGKRAFKMKFTNDGAEQ
jgi:predicted phage-related endonuclease